MLHPLPRLRHPIRHPLLPPQVMFRPLMRRVPVLLPVHLVQQKSRRILLRLEHVKPHVTRLLPRIRCVVERRLDERLDELALHKHRHAHHVHKSLLNSRPGPRSIPAAEPQPLAGVTPLSLAGPRHTPDFVTSVTPTTTPTPPALY